MQRIAAFILIFILFLAATPLLAQVTQQDDSLQQQLVPESFQLRADAVAAKFNWFWNTTVSFSVTNNSGMNLYMGVMRGGVTIGNCTDAEQIQGSLQFLPNPRANAYSVNPMEGPPRGVFVPAGARVSGAIIVANCAAPNPGHPTAPVSLTLMVGATQAFRTMTTFPLSFDTPIRQLQSE